MDTDQDYQKKRETGTQIKQSNIKFGGMTGSLIQKRRKNESVDIT